jgi:hypothetical protein
MQFESLRCKYTAESKGTKAISLMKESALGDEAAMKVCEGKGEFSSMCPAPADLLAFFLTSRISNCECSAVASS